jgi:hypothetical protein
MNYLVVWVDTRSGVRDIRARVTPGGTVLDPAGIEIATAAEWQYAPSVAFDGTNYLVAWTKQRPGVVDIYGTRIRRNGTVLDRPPIAISTAAGTQTSPRVAFDGTNYLVAWDDDRSDSWDIYGARVTPAGAVLDWARFAISDEADDQRSPSVAFDGTNYLVVWVDTRSGSGFRDIYGARVTPGGVVVDPGGIAISEAPDRQYSPSIAFDGTNYLVAWTDERSGIPDIYGARVTQSGTVLDSGGVAISTAANGQYIPSVAFGGTNYLVAWEDERSGSWDVYGGRVTPGGTLLDPTGFLISTGD